MWFKPGTASWLRADHRWVFSCLALALACSSCFHLFSRYLLSNCYMLSPVLGAGDTVGSKPSCGASPGPGVHPITAQMDAVWQLQNELLCSHLRKHHWLGDECLSALSPGSLEVCPSPRIIPPSPTCAEKELPWKSGQGDLAVYVSSETTKIVPVDMQTGWNQSISSLESLASPPCTQAPTMTRLPPRPRAPEEPQAPLKLPLSSDPHSCFAFPPSLAKAGRSRSESSADIPRQQELQPLMGHEDHTHLSPGTANSHWCIHFNKGGRL